MSATQPVVYRYYGDDDRLLYIGATSRLAARLMAHRSQSWWHNLAHRVETNAHPTMEAAFAAEAQAIREESPAFNAVHTGSYFRRRLTPGDLAACREWVGNNPSRAGRLPLSLRQAAA